MVPGEVKERCPLGWSCRGADGKAPRLRARAACEDEGPEIKLSLLLSPFLFFFLNQMDLEQFAIFFWLVGI